MEHLIVMVIIYIVSNPLLLTSVLNGIVASTGGIVKRDNRHIALWIEDHSQPGINVRKKAAFFSCSLEQKPLYLKIGTGLFL